MAAETFTHTGKMVVTECPACFVLHAIPRRMHDERLEEGGSIWCPNGHSWHFTESENAALKKKLRSAQQARDAASAQATHEYDQRKAAERQAAAYKGQVTRIRNRVGNGVCPCCNRSFVNLQRHMSGRHPDFREGD
jgi:hypothetical protein